ncbi:AAA family ATPase [Leucobacter weissii]|uniref:AAA family ATPase n=1 Tax=Leucobacter weissii TaxID=1983706 RepID=A0A939MJJ7_9MICO|nr:AAA family ATPase [Leucobacter weissii]
MSEDLLERDHELARIAARLDRTAAGEGGTVLLLGPAGSGKTSLLRAGADRGRERGFMVLAAGAGELESRTPFGIVRRLFDRALMSLDPGELETLASGPAALAARYVLGREAAPVDHDDLLAGFVRLLDRLSARRRLLIAADDAHWADDESLMLLAALGGRLPGMPVLALVSAREVAAEDRRPPFASLLTGRDAEALRLAALTPEAVRRRLISSWGDADPELTDAVSAATGGNPFLVAAIARTFAGSPRRTADMILGAAPAGVIDSVVARLAALESADRALARAVAVLERTATSVAADLAGLGLADAAAAADRLRAAGLFDEAEGLSFRHALLRNAARSMIGADTREQLHRAAARLLAPDEVHAAAAHLLASSGTGDPWAVALLRDAAAAALDDGAPHTAVTLLRRAMAEPPRHGERADVLLQLGLAELRTLDAGCIASLHEAERGPLGPEDRARCALALSGALSYAGRHEHAAEALDRGLAEAEDAELRLELEAALIAVGLLLPERIGDARRRLAARPELPGATRAERLFLNQQLADAVGTNRPAAEIRELARRAIHPSDSPERTDWVWARLFLVAIGDYGEARRLADEGFARAEARGSALGIVSANFIRAQAEYWMGSFEEAGRHYRAMLEFGESLSAGPLIAMLARSGLVETLVRRGLLADSRELLAQLPEQPPADAPVNGVATALSARSVALHAAGLHREALVAAETLGASLARVGIDSPSWTAWRALAIPPLRALGHEERARVLAVEHLALCERAGVPALLGQALQLAGETSADAVQAISLAERAVEALTGSGARYLEGLAGLSLGAALRRAGQRTRARGALIAARATLADCGAGPDVERADAELTAAGGRTARLAVLGSAALTASERRVADLAATGLSNPEIARALFITVKTVETHLSRAYRKLQIGGRGDLAAALAQAPPSR